MFTGLERGLVLRSKEYEEGKTLYTVILGRKLLFPWMYKTATLYKDWTEDSPKLKLIINEKDKRINKKNFTSPNEEEWDILSEDLKKLPEEQKEYLKKNIENIPEKIKKAIYKTLDIELFPATDNKSLYGFEKQKITNISSGLESLTEKFYKKALSVIPILPL